MTERPLWTPARTPEEARFVVRPPGGPLAGSAFFPDRRSAEAFARHRGGEVQPWR